MPSLVEKRRISCSTRHVNAVICKYDDGSFVVKCANKKLCGDDCPYLKDPDYRSAYRRAPEFRSG